MTMEVVRVENVTKYFTLRKQKSIKESIINSRRSQTYSESFTALQEVSLSIKAGESVGLVGPNGSGKSTLLKIIGGILSPNEGSVLARGRMAALLELGAGFHPDLSGRENVYLNAAILGLKREETDRHFDEILEFSGISDFIDTQVKFYSSGMYVRLAFSVAVHVDPDVLLVDEVLAVGDEPFQQKCMNKIREFQQEGRTIVLVSHSSGQVNDVCDRAIVLERGRVVEDDIPIVALGRLRRDYQGQIAAAAAAQPKREGAFRGEIVRVYLTDSNQSPHHADFQVVMPPGSELRVHGEIDIPEGADDWDLAVTIETTLGVRMLSTTLTQARVQIRPVSGLQAFVLAFPDLQLGEGEYVVNLALRDRNGIPIDELTRAAMFAVRSQKLVTGPVYSAPTLLYL